MREFRLCLYFIVGLLLGAVGTFAQAATWSGPSNIVNRGADGRITGVQLPPNSSAAGVQTSALNGLLNLVESGGWEVLDKAGNRITIPGQQGVSISGAKLAGLAAKSAALLKGGVAGAIINALGQEAINLLNDEWKRTETVTGEYQYRCANAVCLTDSPEAACAAELARAIEINRLSGYSWTFTDRPPIKANDGQSYNCRAWVVHPTYAQEESVGGAFAIQKAPYEKQTPATQADLENALAKRGRMMDSLLKDYYDAVQAADRPSLAQDATYSASGQATQGQPTTSQTVRPDGTTESTTTQTTYNIVNNGNTYNTSVVTVTSITTTTTTADGKTTVKTEQDQVKQPQPTDCEKNPDAVGCMEAGEVPDVELEKKELQGLVSPVDMGGAGQCPAPLSATILGQHVEFSFQPACQFASAMRPIIIALAWLAAGYILIGAIREGT